MADAKICGLTRAEDAALAAAAGARYGGVILAPGRRRTQTLSAAERIFGAAAGLLRVGVFVDPDPAEVRAAAHVLSLDVVQLHGSEAPALVDALRAEGSFGIWKAVRVEGEAALRSAIEAWSARADGLLLDGGAGGSGATFPWDTARWVRAALLPRCTLIVAGGLDAGNVAVAVRTLGADVADVSSGVESSPGIKSEAAVRAFVAGART